MKAIRIATTITKNDHRAMALKSLFTQASVSGGIKEAVKYVVKQLMIGEAISKGSFNSYGCVTLIDEEEGEILYTFHIGNNCQNHKTLDFDDNVELRTLEIIEDMGLIA